MADTTVPRMLGTRVLVRRELPSDRIGSIVVPERSRQTPQEGVVVAVGPEVTTLSTGNRVLFGRYAGIPVTLDERLFTLLWERDVMAIFNDG